MALPNSEKITSQLASMPDQALKRMAMMHKADPYILPLIISEDGRRKQMRQASMARMAAPQPKVADAAVDQMGGVDAMGNVTGFGMPEDQGIARLKTPNIASMADGGIAGYDDFDFAQSSEPVIRMSKGGVTKMSGAELFEKALDMEGITDPKERAFLKAIHGQESSGKSTEKTSNRDAHGAMQILPGTFKQVADKDMDINKPLDNMRAGIRYGKKGYDAAGGDPVLAGAYYYGGPGGMQKAAKGVAVSDPENPKAPTTLGYGKSIAQRMTDLMPIGSAQAGELPTAAPVAAQKTSLESTNAGSNVLAGTMAGTQGLSALQSARDVLTAGFKPGTTAGQASRVLGTAAAVPQAVMLGGAAATKKAMNDLQYMSPEQRREMSSNPMLSAMSGDAGFASAIMDAAANNPEGPSKMPYSQQMANVGKTLVQHPDIDRMREASEAKKKKEQAAAAAVGYNPNNMVPVSSDEFGGVPEPVQEKVIDAAKAVVPEKKGFSLSDEDYLSLGLRLMSSKSPNLLAAAGEAGLGALSDKKEREKAATEKAYKESQTRYSSAYADALERGAKEKNMAFEAEKEVNDYMEKWDRNNKMLALQDPTARAREEQRIRAQIYASAGVKPIMAQQAAPASGGGFRFVGAS